MKSIYTKIDDTFPFLDKKGLKELSIDFDIDFDPTPENEIIQFWQQIIAELPKNLQSEASNLGFKLESDSSFDQERTVKCYHIVPNGSEELKKKIKEFGPFVVYAK
jgi:hypothetical protein